MNPGLVGLAVVVVAGGVLAVTARESRAAVLGVAFVAILSPLIADPVPATLPLAARLVGGLLAGYLMWVALRSGTPTRGSAIGWPADALVACAAVAAGTAIEGVAGGGTLDGGGAGPREAIMAGVALAALAIGPMLGARDVLRLAVGLMLAVHAVGLVRAGIAGTAPGFEQLAMAGLVATLGAAGATLAVMTIRATGGLSLEFQRRAGAHLPDPSPGRVDAPVSGKMVSERSAGTRPPPRR